MYRKFVISSAVLALAVASLAIPLAGTTGIAQAGPVASPHGLCGARNMVNPAARPHMLEAMAMHTAPQGDAGMMNAIAVSACD
jgi:hypothetical protein